MREASAAARPAKKPSASTAKAMAMAKKREADDVALYTLRRAAKVSKNYIAKFAPGKSPTNINMSALKAKANKDRLVADLVFKASGKSRLFGGPKLVFIPNGVYEEKLKSARAALNSKQAANKNKANAKAAAKKAKANAKKAAKKARARREQKKAEEPKKPPLPPKKKVNEPPKKPLKKAEEPKKPPLPPKKKVDEQKQPPKPKLVQSIKINKNSTIPELKKAINLLELGLAALNKKKRNGGVIDAAGRATTERTLALAKKYLAEKQKSKKAEEPKKPPFILSRRRMSKRPKKPEPAPKPVPKKTVSGLSVNKAKEQIRKLMQNKKISASSAFKRLSLKYHPNKGGSSKNFITLQKARDAVQAESKNDKSPKPTKLRNDLLARVKRNVPRNTNFSQGRQKWEQAIKGAKTNAALSAWARR